MPAVFFRHEDLPFIEARRAHDSKLCYRPHTHPTLSIGMVDAGSTILSMPHCRVPMVAGDVVIIGPHVVHSCNPRRNVRWSYRMLYVDVSWLQPRDMEWRPIVRTATARVAFEKVFAILASRKPSHDSAKAIRMLLNRILRTAERPLAVKARAAFDELDAVREYIAANCDRSLGIAHLSRQVGVPSFTLIRRFKNRFGLTPHAYQLDQRVVRARELLKSKSSAAEVAYTLGFADQSHLIRVFKPRVAATPRQFVQR